MKILFVGDKPSSKNTSPEIPFVGTPSYKRLLNWIYELNLDLNRVSIKNREQVVPEFVPLNEYVIVCLGNEAEKHLAALGCDYYKLPHPSPRNFKLNNKRFEMAALRSCREYLKKKGVYGE